MGSTLQSSKSTQLEAQCIKYANSCQCEQHSPWTLMRCSTVNIHWWYAPQSMYTAEMMCSTFNIQRWYALQSMYTALIWPQSTYTDGMLGISGTLMRCSTVQIYWWLPLQYTDDMLLQSTYTILMRCSTVHIHDDMLHNPCTPMGWSIAHVHWWHVPQSKCTDDKFNSPVTRCFTVHVHWRYTLQSTYTEMILYSRIHVHW